MKNLTIVSTFVLLLTTGLGQLHYEISFETNQDENDLKTISTRMRLSKIQMYNYVSEDSLVKFDSYSNFTQDSLESILNDVQILSFVKSKNVGDLSHLNINKGTDCESAQLVCSNTSFSANSSGYGVDDFTSDYYVYTYSGSSSNNCNTNRANAQNMCRSIYGDDNCYLINETCTSSGGVRTYNYQFEVPIYGCIYSGEVQSSWYYINVSTGGTLTMLIDPSNDDDDYDFAIWGPFNSSTANANCPPVTAPIRCNYSAAKDLTGFNLSASNNSEDQYGSTYSRSITTSVGDVYILLVNNYSNSGQPYNLSWGGTATLGCVTVVLNVELIEFEGKELGRNNFLSWSVVEDRNNDFYEIEKSEDGLIWDKIGFVKSAGNSDDKKNYSFIDEKVKLIENYYRLKSVDYNGVRQELKIISIDNSPNNKILLRRINSFGQEVDQNYKGLVIEHYTDGTILKTIQ